MSTDLSKTAMQTPNKQQQVLVVAADLPVHCPLPSSSLWNSHPRVYIPLQVGQVEKVICPYCGTEYILHDPDEDS